ncbi:MAG: GGDEF domain-containing protein [Sulfurospirillum sp.]|nr:GGDEF domain-containing protein [Sulfurospirillum sp.]
MQAVIQTKKGKKKVFAHALVCEQNPKASGVICLLGKLENDYSFLAKSISTHLAFAIFLIQKKEANIKFLEQLTQKNDSLNIPNNTALQTKIEYEFGRSKRYHTNLSLIIFQIDHLENLSNIFDEKVIINLKKNFINLIKKNIRSTDLFGTWIGEKFAIVSSDIDFRAAKNLAHKLTKILAQQHFPQVAKITCSFGITSLAQNDTMANFRQRAENALQEAIAKGGNNIEVKIVV